MTAPNAPRPVVAVNQDRGARMAVNENVVATLLQRYDLVYGLRLEVQQDARDTYNRFTQRLDRAS